MNMPPATSAVIGWIDMRPVDASPWLAGGADSPAADADDLATDLSRLGGRPFSARTHSPVVPAAVAARFAPRAPLSSFAAPCGAFVQIFANLAELSRELDVRIAEIRARLKAV